MDLSPLVSIVIPTFNRCEYLKETLYSIFNQTYTNFEVIVISDSSSDDTSAMIKGLNDKRCSLYKLDNKSNGPAFVRNFGLSKCTGALVAFCDDDDLWHPEKLNKQVKIMVTKPKVVLSATNVTYFGDVKPIILYFSKIKGLLNRMNFIPRKYLLAFYNGIVISSSMIRTDVLNNLRFNEENEYQGHEDLDLWLRICANHKAYILPEYLTLYRVHDNQISSTLNKAYKKQSFYIIKKTLAQFDFLQRCIFSFRIFIYKISNY